MSADKKDVSRFTEIRNAKAFRDYAIAERFEAGIQLALEKLMVSPDFLFRVERDPDTVVAGSAYRISDLELASRLAFFLWSSIPDDELLDAAVLVADRDGIDGLSVAAVTHAAGVAKGTFYVHFTDRSTLLLELHRRFHDDLFAAIAERSVDRPCTYIFSSSYDLPRFTYIFPSSACASAR